MISFFNQEGKFAKLAPTHDEFHDFKEFIESKTKKRI